MRRKKWVIAAPVVTGSSAWTLMLAPLPVSATVAPEDHAPPLQL